MLIIEENAEKNFLLQDFEQDIDKLKAEFCESLFEREGNTVRCNNVYLNNFYNQLYNKYPKKIPYEEFLSECMYYTFLAIMDFDVMDSGSWEQIVDGTDKTNIGRLLTYIRTSVNAKIYQFVVNGDKLFTRGEVEGKKSQHVMVKLNLISLETVITDDNGNSTTLKQIISNEQNFFNRKYKYYWNYFIQWFMENKDNILTKKQLKYLETNESCSRKNKRIRERVLRFWEKENPLNKITMSEYSRRIKLQLLQTFLNIVDDENIENSEIGQCLTRWIAKNMEHDFIADMLYDNFFDDEIKCIVKAYHDEDYVIPNHILYEIVNVIERHREELKRSECHNSCKSKNVSNSRKKALKKHKQYQAYLQRFKNQQCFVYQDGQFVKTITEKNKKKLNILEVTPTGVELATFIE